MIAIDQSIEFIHIYTTACTNACTPAATTELSEEKVTSRKRVVERTVKEPPVNVPDDNGAGSTAPVETLG